MKHLKEIQDFLEDCYGAKTGLDVRDFTRVMPEIETLGSLLVQEDNGDLDIALLLDRDIYHDFNRNKRATSVPFEEISHFVYLCFNHMRGRNVTKLEMEIQGEVDRVLLAYHSQFGVSERIRSDLLGELVNEQYELSRYETARKCARSFLLDLSAGDPHAWSQNEFEKLSRFFHSDLPEKLHQSKAFK